MRIRRALGLLALVPLAVGTCGLRAGTVSDRWFDDDPAVVVPLADAVARAVAEGSDPEHFHTFVADYSEGSDRFDGEWALVTCQMAMLGLSQVAGDDPELRARYAPAARGCIRFLLSPGARAFGTAAWGEDGLARLDSDHGHAYLGWTNLALGAALRLVDDPEAARVHGALSDALARRMDLLPVHRFETYPGETYPPDLSVVTASVAMTGRHPDTVARFVTKLRAAAVDPATGLLYQALSPISGAPGDAVRGSGTTLAAMVLATSEPALATELARAVRRELQGEVLGFGGVREVPRGAPWRMDIDSGPVLFGLSVSASGFGFTSARLTGDRDWHRSLYRSAHLVGLPYTRGDERWFATGGTLGNAILLATLTGGPR